MKKRTLTPPAPTVSGNGLCPADEKILRDVLARLEVFCDRLHLLGAAEREQVSFVLAKIKIRLAPAPIDGIVAAAQKLIERYGVTLDAGRAATIQREAEFQEIAVKRKAAREARAALIAAKAAEKERQRVEALKAWQGKA